MMNKNSKQRLLIEHLAQIATPTGNKAKHGKAMQDITFYEDVAIYIEDGIIKAVGNTADIIGKVAGDDLTVIDGSGKCAVPGFIDPHTHFLFGGTRADEFISRLEGVSYMELHRRGGGIVSTMKSTRALSEAEMVNTGKQTLAQMLKEGFTTVEGKSGYGLDKDTELKMLRAMGKMNDEQPVSVVRTFLGAHAVPPEFVGKPDAYIDFLINDVLPEVADKHLAKFCDVFCEKGVFTIEQSRKLLLAAQQKGLKLKIHADEIVSTGGGGLGAELKATSADHLLAVSDKDIASLANSDTITTLLPMTAFCMRKNFAPARKMIDSGCVVALASDFNPGSCYSYSVPLILSLAVIGMQMTINEALTAITLNAAAAVDEADSIGSIEVGKQADILLLQKPDYRFLVYLTGINIVEHVIKNGKLIF